MNNKKISSVMLLGILSISVFYPSQAVENDVFGKAENNQINISQSKSSSQIQQKSALSQAAHGNQPVNFETPKITHVRAVTEVCVAGKGCNIQGCSQGDKKGVLLQALYAPIEEKKDDPYVGAHIDWNDTDALAGWTRGETFCSTSLADPSEDETFEELMITVSQEDFQSLPLAPAQLNLPNAQGHTLKNANTNIWAKAETQNLTTEINGSPVRVEATPVAYVFTYGDGQKLETTNPGYGLHEDDGWDVETPTSHIYKETGNYPVSVTTIYTGRYSVDGGPWLPVNGTAQATSEEKTVRVWRVRAGNVADTCVENPRGWGCPGT